MVAIYYIYNNTKCLKCQLLIHRKYFLFVAKCQQTAISLCEMRNVPLGMRSFFVAKPEKTVIIKI